MESKTLEEFAAKLNLTTQGEAHCYGVTMAHGPGGWVRTVFGDEPKGCSGRLRNALSVSLDCNAIDRSDQVNDIVNELVSAGMLLAHYRILGPREHHQCWFCNVGFSLLFYFDPRSDRHVELVRKYICDRVPKKKTQIERKSDRRDEIELTDSTGTRWTM